ETSLRLSVPHGEGALEAGVWTAPLPGSSATTYFIEQPALFDRDGLYQVQGKDHPDNLARFSVFSQAALRLLPALGWQPDILHAHDWQTSLVPAQLRVGAMAQEPLFAPIGTVLTIHNLAYQGLFPKDQWALTRLPWSAFTMQGLEFYHQINCLKGGLVCADALTTVSPTYAAEIRTKEFGCGLEGVLEERREDLAGILNGIDPDAWDPRSDRHIAAPYGPESLAGKARCKLDLQRRQGLAEGRGLLIGMIQRLAEQKGIDIFTQALERLMALPVQLVLLGTGEPKYHEQLTALAAKFRGRFALALAFDNALAHQIEAGADAFLMPSRFEPCGLNQMYSMRFGTVPIVRRVGGLADTVVDATPPACAQGGASGFVFEPYTAEALLTAVRRAATAFQDRRLWARLMQTGMQQDFSWTRSARAYERVYQRVLAKKLQPAVSPKR
ncbi:MAG: glycogen synthase GlgA, partial [Candidatus Omnitrophica bacterium]|nr:glycogen synthase GlgA [Candidatus Omnitrophota bacterium]